MYLLFLIFGALACLPEIDIGYASLELHAWLLIGISVSPFVRREAASALESSGDLAIDVLPDLLSRVSNNDDTAWFSIQAIGNLGPKAKEAVPILLPLLHFNYPETGYNGGMVRQYAVEALGKISTDTNVIGAIQQSLNDPDPNVRKEAEEVLKKERVAKP